ncbi:Hypothetical protein A7982_07253 [Minicystis rosea]|nr:Hypothetical protein A7982_07253 [Minicystis rosea]
MDTRNAFPAQATASPSCSRAHDRSLETTAHAEPIPRETGSFRRSCSSAQCTGIQLRAPRETRSGVCLSIAVLPEQKQLKRTAWHDKMTDLAQLLKDAIIQAPPISPERAVAGLFTIDEGHIVFHLDDPPSREVVEWIASFELDEGLISRLRIRQAKVRFDGRMEVLELRGAVRLAPCPTEGMKMGMVTLEDVEPWVLRHAMKSGNQVLRIPKGVPGVRRESKHDAEHAGIGHAHATSLLFDVNEPRREARCAGNTAPGRIVGVRGCGTETDEKSRHHVARPKRADCRRRLSCRHTPSFVRSMAGAASDRAKHDNRRRGSPASARWAAMEASVCGPPRACSVKGSHLLGAVGMPYHPITFLPDNILIAGRAIELGILLVGQLAKRLSVGSPNLFGVFEHEGAIGLKPIDLPHTPTAELGIGQLHRPTEVEENELVRSRPDASIDEEELSIGRGVMCRPAERHASFCRGVDAIDSVSSVELDHGLALVILSANQIRVPVEVALTPREWERIGAPENVRDDASFRHDGYTASRVPPRVGSGRVARDLELVSTRRRVVHFRAGFASPCKDLGHFAPGFEVPLWLRAAVGHHVPFRAVLVCPMVDLG